MNPTCDTCRWWEKHCGAIGRCRARSPAATNAVSEWPLTDAVDWCGEHQPRETAVEKSKVRLPGPYWCKTRLNLWMVRYWTGNYWLMPGCAAAMTDTNDWQIDERRIERSPA